MKRIVLITLIALIMLALFAASSTLLIADSSSSAGATMQVANQVYEAGQFEQAAQVYQQLVAQGYEDSVLFYNLGNSYYKQGDHGRAILNYRRAQQLAPRDPDIEANLALARAQAGDQFEVAGHGGVLDRTGKAVQDWFTFNELAMAALGAWISFVLLLILVSSAKAGSTLRTGLTYGLVAVAVVLAVGLLALGSYAYADSRQTAGVVVAGEVDVTSGPGAQYLTTFTLHSGTEVDLVETRGNWVHLALPGTDMDGWVPATVIEPVGG